MIDLEFSDDMDLSASIQLFRVYRALWSQRNDISEANPQFSQECFVSLTPSRRRFLQLSSTAMAASVFSPRAMQAAAPVASAAKARPIGFSLYGMKSLPVLDALDECARIGYNNVEICVMKDFPTALPQFDRATQLAVRDRARKHRLDISSLLVHGNLFREEAHQKKIIEEIKRAGEISQVLDEKQPPLLESVMGGKTEEWDHGKHMMVDRLTAWLEAADSVGVRFSVKAHYGNAVHSPERLLWLYRQVNHPALALTYDYSHYKAEGFDMEETMRQVIPHASFIHVKDVALWRPVRFLFPGEGTIDWVRYFELIRELNYTGPILVEVSAHIHRLAKYEPIPAAELCHAALSQARDQAYAT